MLFGAQAADQRAYHWRPDLAAATTVATVTAYVSDAVLLSERYGPNLTNLGLTELPPLPAGIRHLYCSGNRLTTLPADMPDTIEHIYCHQNELTELIPRGARLPANLILLDCHKNRLARITDNLPAGLTSLFCGQNQLKYLPPMLPFSLQTLHCSQNRLKALPESLPAGLSFLVCSWNRLRTLPSQLPKELHELYCDHNALPEQYDLEPWREYLERITAEQAEDSKERIVRRCRRIFEELAKTVWHPRRVERLMLAGVDAEDM